MNATDVFDRLQIPFSKEVVIIGKRLACVKLLFYSFYSTVTDLAKLRG